MKPETLLLGAHCSTAGGLQNALLEGVDIGATTIQLFTSNQRQWKQRALDEAIINNWKKVIEETGMKEIMSHDSYLINLGSPDPEGLQKSRDAFRAEVIRCRELGITYLNFHPGAALTESEEKCLDTIVASLLQLRDLLPDSSTRLLLEATAGQGSSLGYSFEQLDYVVSRVKDQIPVGVCIDTCHIFAAGYDMRTAEACDHTLKEFDRIVGLEHLYAFHLNDSAKGLGTFVDRHKPLGKGEIGIECFKFLMTDKRTRHLPKYLETPDGPPLWREEIQMLRNFAKG